MQILITGGAGFIGSMLVDRLINDDNNKIFVVDNFNDYYDPKIKEQNIKHNLYNKNYILHRLDICDKEGIERIFKENAIDLVIHLAARAGVRPSLQDPIEYVRSNIEGTINLLENMKNSHNAKMIFASSSSVYGNCTADKFSENLNLSKPISPYAATKLACEQLLYTYSYLYKISVICLRFFTVYGPRQRPDLAIRKFIELIQKDEPIQMYGDGTSMRDYTYIDDILDGICSAIKYKSPPPYYEIINLGGGSPINLKQMIETIESVLNKKAEIVKLPMQLGDVNKTISDISKAKKLLNYEPKINFELGIKKFLEWKTK